MRAYTACALIMCVLAEKALAMPAAKTRDGRTLPATVMVNGCQWLTWTDWMPCDCDQETKSREMRPVESCGTAVVFAEQLPCTCDNNGKEVHTSAAATSEPDSNTPCKYDQWTPWSDCDCGQGVSTSSRFGQGVCRELSQTRVISCSCSSESNGGGQSLSLGMGNEVGTPQISNVGDSDEVEIPTVVGTFALENGGVIPNPDESDLPHMDPPSPNSPLVNPDVLSEEQPSGTEGTGCSAHSEWSGWIGCLCNAHSATGRTSRTATLKCPGVEGTTVVQTQSCSCISEISDVTVAASSKGTIVRMTVDGDINTFSSAEFIADLASLLSVPVDDIQLLQISAGSVVITLAISPDAANKLVEIPNQVLGVQLGLLSDVETLGTAADTSAIAVAAAGGGAEDVAGTFGLPFTGEGEVGPPISSLPPLDSEKGFGPATVGRQAAESTNAVAVPSSSDSSSKTVAAGAGAAAGVAALGGLALGITVWRRRKRRNVATNELDILDIDELSEAPDNPNAAHIIGGRGVRDSLLMPDAKLSFSERVARMVHPSGASASSSRMVTSVTAV